MPFALAFAAAVAFQNPAVVPVPRESADWLARHNAMNAAAAQGDVELVFVGDSITHAFGGPPNTGENFLNRGGSTWDFFYGDRKALNLGISGDQTQHVLWRLRNGNLKGIRPKVAVVMIGTNNQAVNTAEQIAEGVQAVCSTIRELSPSTRVLLLAIFPRGGAATPDRVKVDDTNALLRAWANRTHVEYLDIGVAFLDDKEIPAGVMPDKLHPMAGGYRRWAVAMEPRLASMLEVAPKWMPLDRK